MARRTARPEPSREIDLPALTRARPECGGTLWAAYKTSRTAITLDGTVRLCLQVRRCRDRRCPRFGTPWRPEQEGRIVPPRHESGLDLIAAIGRLRHAEHRSLPDIRAELDRCGVPICVRSVGNLLDRYEGPIAEMTRDAGAAGSISEAVGHFLKVTRSNWPGLFARYDAAGLPRTNNDLEQFFGSYRCNERRAGGRKVASPGTVVRGSVRLIASAVTRLRQVDGSGLAPTNPAAWRLLRRTLDGRQATRTLARRFRRDPATYLKSIEEALIKETLPS